VASPDIELSVRAAAAFLGEPRKALQRAIDKGRLPARTERVAPGPRGVRRYLNQKKLEKLPSCEYPRCERPALGPHGGCASHGFLLAPGKPRAQERSCERCGKDLGVIRPSLPQAGFGRFCSERCSALKYGDQPRTCEQCGEEFLPRHRKQRFCTLSCSSKRPHGDRKGQLVTCTCGETRYRSPSQVQLEHCTSCVGQARRDWWVTSAGMAERERVSARTNSYWDDVYAALEAVKADRGALDTALVRSKLGGLSTPTVTRYYVAEKNSLTVEPIVLGGQQFLLYTEPSEVRAIQEQRATGPAWSTWLDYDWMLKRARKSGIIDTLVGHGLTEAEAEDVIRRDVANARRLLGVFRGAEAGRRASSIAKVGPKVKLTSRDEEIVRGLLVQGLGRREAAKRASVLATGVAGEPVTITEKQVRRLQEQAGPNPSR
jgi:hypothetical protein